MKPTTPSMITISLGLLMAACSSGTAPAGGNATPSAAQTTSAPANVACNQLPDHVALIDDAKVSLCTRGKPFPNRESGTIFFTTARPAINVIGWYREHAHAAGFSDGIGTATTYSVVPKGGKSMMVLTRPADNGTQVTINWGRAI